MKKLHFRQWLLGIAALLILLVLPGRAKAADLDDIRQQIIYGYEQKVELVDLRAYSLTTDQLRELYDELYYGGQLPWYTDVYQVSSYTDTGLAAYFYPEVKDPMWYDYTLYEQTVAEILDQTVYPGMSDWQIALSIHDYLAANYAYDETYTYNTGYDLLVRGTAVCAGYAEAYMDLMNRVGIPCRYVSSEAMDHGWNQVMIGGNWYHVDVTWDDPISNIQGQVLHEFFLISDTAISDADHEHYGWDSYVLCTDTTLDTDRFWHGVTSQICYPSSDTSYVRYYNDNNAYGIYMRDESDGDLTEIGWLDLGYLDIGYGLYGYPGDGLSLWNGRIYYSDMECVYSRLTDGSDWRVEYTLPVSSYGMVICGSFVKDGRIHLQLRDHNGNLDAITVSTLDTNYHTHSYQSQVFPADCITYGYTLHSCGCGFSYTTDPIYAGEHRFGEPETIQSADTSHTGLVAYTCTVCGYYMTEETPMLESDSDSWFSRDDSSEEDEEEEYKYEEDEDKSLSDRLTDAMDSKGTPFVVILLAALVIKRLFGKKKN